MKFGIPWGVKGNRNQASGTNPEPVFDHTGAEPFVNPTAHASIVPDVNLDDTHRSSYVQTETRLQGLGHDFDLEKAIAEISARRNMLDVEPPMPLPVSASAPDLSGLEAQLRKLTEQIETLYRPSIEEAIDAIRSDLKNVRHLLTERAPKRTGEMMAASAADTSTAGLSAEFWEGSQSNQGAAADGLRNEIAALAQKIDLIAVQSDPVPIQRIESSIASLRELCDRLVSNETNLADCVRALAQKIERTPGGTANTGTEAIGHLEDRIVTLMQRLDASDSKFNRLEAIERGITDLLVHIDHIRAEKNDRSRTEAPTTTTQLRPDAARRAAADAATRIAASEAALAGVQTSVPSGERSNFILAARRAAQVAAQESLPRDSVRIAREQMKPAEPSRSKRRIKSVVIAACIVVIVIGSLQIASKFFSLGKLVLSGPHAAHNIVGRKIGGTTGSIPLAKSADNAGALLSRTAPPSGNVATAHALDLTSPQSMIHKAVPAEKEKSSSSANQSADVTGSIAHRVSTSQPIVPPIPMPPDITNSSAMGGSDLPDAIGSDALRKAAAAGNPGAAYEIGIRYAEGRGVPQSFEQAAHWFGLAATHGLAPAEFHLASLYEKGLGVQKDLARARTLYLAAAEKGNAKAMHNLAVLYAEGVDDKPDYATAAHWFLKAANYGITDSQYNLAILYARGLGVKKSYSESYKWFALAAQKGDQESAKKRDEIAKQLDPKTLAAAQEAVKAWAAKPQPAEATTVPRLMERDAQKAGVPAKSRKPQTPG